MTMQVCFAANWLEHYLDIWSEQIVTGTGLTLTEEYISTQKKIEKSKELKRKLLNLFEIENLPFDLQENLTRSKLNIPPHIWDSYSPEIRGKTIAAEIVQSRIELIERFMRELESNKKQAIKDNESKTKQNGGL